MKDYNKIHFLLLLILYQLMIIRI